MESAALDRGNSLRDELGPAIQQPRLVGAVGQRLARNILVVGLVRLAEIGGVGAGNGALGAHPVHGGAGVEAPGKGNTDAFADGKFLQNAGNHVSLRDFL